MMKQSPNLVHPIPRRNNEARDEEVDNDNSIIYPEHNIHNTEEKRSRFDPFQPIHPQCNHISFGCLTMVFLMFVGMVVLLKMYLPVIFPLSTTPSFTPTPAPQRHETFYLCKDDGTLLSNTHMKENGQIQSENPIGCFEDQSSVDSKTFSDMNNIVQDCSQYCSTDFFGLAGATCKCFSDTPPNRLSISSCCDVQYDGVRLDVYYKRTWSDECNQDITRNLRDQLVQENNADLGYDIVRNTYLPSPFEFYNDGCGTNIYDLKTDVSGNSGSMTTTSNNLKEYAMEKRSHVSNSIGVSASLEYKGLFKKASIQASASFDSEMNSAFQSSGASKVGSKRFSSFGVHKLSEIDLVNFNRKKYFATFNDEFIDALRHYITSGYAKPIAKEIFDSFGMVVVEYGVVGGFVQISATAVSSDLSDYFSSEAEMKRCYETAVSGSGKFGPVSGSFNAENNGCVGAALEFMESRQEQFSSEVEETNYVGGSIVPVVGTERDVFSVTPETAKLLTNADMYDDGDGMRLRLITDFLNPKKINPFEIKRHLLTEAQFEEARMHLQNHALEILEDIGGFLDDCLPCAGVPYLELQSGTDEFMCDCYEPLYPENKFIASDGSINDSFGWSCSISGDVIVVGSIYAGENNEGTAYLFHLNGNEIKKLTPGNDGQYNDWYGNSVSMDEKIVVGSYGENVRVFSRNGTYERTLTCDDCQYFGVQVATHGNLIVAGGYQNSIATLFVYKTDGELLKSFKQGRSNFIAEVAISEQFIISTTKSGDKTIIYSNTSPDFPKIAEIDQGGYKVAVAGERLVIGDFSANDYDGAAWLYTTDGTLVTTLDRQDSTSESRFGESVAITDDKVIVSARLDDDGGEDTGSIFIYSAITGEFIKKLLAPDGEPYDEFGSSVCASHSHYIVGATGVDDNESSSGAAYLFNFPS